MTAIPIVLLTHDVLCNILAPSSYTRGLIHSRECGRTMGQVQVGVADDDCGSDVNVIPRVLVNNDRSDMNAIPTVLLNSDRFLVDACTSDMNGTPKVLLNDDRFVSGACGSDMNVIPRVLVNTDRAEEMATGVSSSSVLPSIAPSAQKTQSRDIKPDENKVTAFVFKIQANMDPKHRDRMAFVRICSGKFKKGPPPMPQF